MVGILAELERSLIQERTKAGRAAAQARGVKMGRKPLLTAQQIAHARKLREQGETPAHVAKLLNVSSTTTRVHSHWVISAMRRWRYERYAAWFRCW
jgi:DNA invertase Pin-like site-specific DNA recombinase